MMFFLAGIANVKLSIVLFLQAHHMPISLGFLIATSMAAMQLICMFSWPRLFKYIAPPSYASLISFGAGLSALSILLLYFYQTNISILTLSLTMFVVGNSLFLINIRTLVSLHDHSLKEKHHANQLFYLGMNVGGILGLLGSSAIMLGLEFFAAKHVSYQNVYLLNFFLLSIASFHMYKNRKTIINPPSESTLSFSFIKFSTLTTSVFIVVWICLLETDLTRALVITLFLATLYFNIANRKTSGIPLVLFFSLLLTNIIFWVVLSIMYFQFCTFIHDYTSLSIGHYNIPVFALYIFDPLACLIMGILIVSTKFARGSPLFSFRMGFGFMMVTFATVAYSIISSYGQTVAIGWVILAVLLYGLGEFLIAPSIMAQLAAITPEKPQLRSLMGTLSLSTAMANILSFYVMKISYNNTTDIRTSLNGDYSLFLSLALFLMGVWVIIYLVSFIKRIGEVRKNGRTINGKDLERRKR